jgi:cell division transport system permease protein
MKIRTTKYVIKEGLFNAYKNKLMSMASLSTVAASLLVFGIFLLFTINLSQNMKYLEEQPEMSVYCDYNLDDTQVNSIESSIKSNQKIKGYTKTTKAQGLAEIKKKYKDYEGVLSEIDDSFVPVKFVIKLKNSKDSDELVKLYRSMPEIEKVEYNKKVISALILLILLIVSIFIIANTIKLTVFARRKEINIMKYIGATDWFIRWPFVVEGLIIGLIGAFVAFIITAYGYSVLEGQLSQALSELAISVLKVAPLREIGFTVAALYTVIGATIGALGSIISIRKHLHV